MSDLEHISWIKYNDDGLQVGENLAHWADWETGKTLCGIDLRPTKGVRAGWDRHNYDGGRDVSLCCQRCEASKEKIDNQQIAEEKEYEEIVEQKKAKLESQVCGRFLIHTGPYRTYDNQDAFVEELIPNENFYRIYYKGDNHWTEVDQETYEFFKTQVDLVS